ncbi:hypothetical protein F3Y22_tig00116984pilonHSYRG00096 [Hibiscus syriacus]|uniref:Uncharacterized protein n=1 Tax=Hibiscus syriacus TaxID=106335 RepID=A0A6A2WPF9_HIBSY|nr:hypothetical protein F3Y22_tig00116984pilonHSYRG00096 [Hibiscus syriacus]
MVLSLPLIKDYLSFYVEVTCVQFNPVDDNYFISGSIDGKVGIVGSMTGSCQFYNVADNRLQLDVHIYLTGKKRSPCKRITGLQFLPQDSSKVMVTCDDSQVRILQGLNVICKYTGARNGGNQAFASLTPDGKHIVSTCEYENVYVWNCVDQDEQSRPHAKDVRSCK